MGRELVRATGSKMPARPSDCPGNKAWATFQPSDTGRSACNVSGTSYLGNYLGNGTTSNHRSGANEAMQTQLGCAIKARLPMVVRTMMEPGGKSPVAARSEAKLIRDGGARNREKTRQIQALAAKTGLIESQDLTG